MKTNKIIILFSILVSVVSLHAQTAEKLLRQGNRSYDKGDYEEAQIKYKQAIEAMPTNVKAVFNLGDALYASGDYEGAMQSFQKTIELTVDAKVKSEAAFNMGVCLLTQDKIYDAFLVFQQALRYDVDNELALHNMEYCRSKLVKSRIIIDESLDQGKITSNMSSAFQGQTITLSAQPADNYALKQYRVVKADNHEVEMELNGSQFVMPTHDVFVSAEFKKGHAITVDKNIKHGKIKADRQSAMEGQQVKLLSEPESGYLVEYYRAYKTGSPKDTVQVNDTIFVMPDFPVSVTASFARGLKVKVLPSENGKLTPSDTLSLEGRYVGLVVKPEKGFELDDIVVENINDASERVPVSDDNVFQMPGSSVTVKATFGEATQYYKVVIDTAMQNGAVVADCDSATRRETVLLKNIPAPGYKFKEYVIHQVGDTIVKVQPVGNTFAQPHYDVMVSATFEKDDQNQNQDQNQDDNKQEQQQQEQENQDNKQDQNNQQDQQQQQNQENRQEQEQQQQSHMSKEDAARMLQAIENQEKQTIEKVNEQKIRTQPKKKSDKEW